MPLLSVSKLPTDARLDTLSIKPIQLLGAFLLAVMIMYGAALLQTSAVHNAAHDMRHSQGFPCH